LNSGYTLWQQFIEYESNSSRYAPSISNPRLRSWRKEQFISVYTYLLSAAAARRRRRESFHQERRQKAYTQRQQESELSPPRASFTAAAQKERAEQVIKPGRGFCVCVSPPRLSAFIYFSSVKDSISLSLQAARKAQQLAECKSGG